VALAYGVVIDESHRTHWLRIGIACDRADAMASILVAARVSASAHGVPGHGHGAARGGAWCRAPEQGQPPRPGPLECQRRDTGSLGADYEPRVVSLS
jgi:hypothetical protein